MKTYSIHVLSSTILLLLMQYCSAQFTPLVVFDSETGGLNPDATLITDGTYLYGTTSAGPYNDLGAGYGTIFRLMPDGSSFETLYEFQGEPDGRVPICGFYYDGTWLYGTTEDGGEFSAGTVYKLKPDGSEYQIIYNFQGQYEGLWPHAGVISDGTYLYGMTNRGGDNSDGLIYRLLPDGTGYETLHEFSEVESGKYPEGELLYDGTWLYGLTQIGGVNNNGVMFRIMPDGSSFEKLLDFELNTSGEYCMASFLLMDGWLYAMNQSGGENGQGLLFKVQPDGSNFTVLLNFNLLVTGRAGTSTPITDGTYLYCMTNHGGQYDDGVIFRIKPDGTEFLMMFEFQDYVTGQNPTAGLLMIDNFLYGATNIGGENGDGVVFKFQYQPPADIEQSEDLSNLQIYPNPANEVLTLNWKNNTTNEQVNISITDVNGKIVWRSSRSSFNQTKIDTSQLVEGVYSMSIQSMKTNLNSKFVIAH
jgi:uncharacterized repeat protein (TIGR03803 family)